MNYPYNGEHQQFKPYESFKRFLIFLFYTKIFCSIVINKDSFFKCVTSLSNILVTVVWICRKSQEILGITQSFSGTWSIFLNSEIWCFKGWFSMLHWYQFSAFYQEFLNLGGHILLRTLLHIYPANLMTRATLVAIHKKQFLPVYEMSQDLTFLMNMFCR